MLCPRQSPDAYSLAAKKLPWTLPASNHCTHRHCKSKRQRLRHTLKLCVPARAFRVVTDAPQHARTLSATRARAVHLCRASAAAALAAASPGGALLFQSFGRGDHCCWAQVLPALCAHQITTMASTADIDGWLEKLRRGEHLEEHALKQLCDIVKDILAEECNVQNVGAPVTVCGDIHGQFHDLLKLLQIGGDLPATNYVFMGDFVDRGYHSVETFELLMCLKARWPGSVTLLRGNHEARQITQVYGFYDECMKKYGNANAWRYCVEVFDHLNLAAVIEGRIFCVHGGLSPDITTVDQVRTLERCQEPPQDGPFADLLWSDPEDVGRWMTNPRGAGFLFGSEVVQEFNHINGLELICRAHQLVMEGFKYMFEEKSLVTVWSAPNYCYRSGNVASVLTFSDKLEREFKIFKEAKESEELGVQGISLSYFL